MKRILILTDWFYPGFRAGGLITASLNLSRQLSKNHEVFILTSDRDLGNPLPYADVSPNSWHLFEFNIHVCYLSPDLLNWNSVLKEIQKIDPSFVFLNSMFSKCFTVFPLLMKKLKLFRARVIVSPRGMLMRSALAMKPMKKWIFLKLLKLYGIHRIVGFHATSINEKMDIYRVFGRVQVTVIPDVPPKPESDCLIKKKVTGELKLIFVGRIHRIKNLHYLLKCLTPVRQMIYLTVAGPIEDHQYFLECKEASDLLPNNIKVTFVGDKNSIEIRQLLLDHHFFVLPTCGENYGYSIVESFAAGRPVIISDNTPWHELSTKRIGWDLPLNNTREFTNAIQRASFMDEVEYSDWSSHSLQFAKQLYYKDLLNEKYSMLFQNSEVA
ncbi:MAG TPA: glycosyltransferase family 4 protein [Chitinophagaceae bacterium]|nr:glycosyltransferase family 4 protein [Chitinophagaceae bacterium]